MISGYRNHDVILALLHILVHIFLNKLSFLSLLDASFLLVSVKFHEYSDIIISVVCSVQGVMVVERF